MNKQFLPTLVTLVLVLMTCFVLSCDDEQAIGERELPQTSRTFLNTHFNGVNVLAIEKSKGGYSVQLANNIEIDFDARGEWIKVDANGGVILPVTFIHPGIVAYVQENYPGNPINEVEKLPTTFAVELARQDIDLVFDLQGGFLRVDP